MIADLIRGFIAQNGAIEAADFLCALGRLQSRELHFDAGRLPPNRSIHNYYRHTSSATSCPWTLWKASRFQTTKVPVVAAADIIRMQQLLRAQSYDRMPNVHCLTVPGPHYYIIGLRKIII